MKKEKSISDCLINDEMSKGTQRRWNFWLMILYGIGIIALPFIVFFHSTIKVGFTTPFVIMIVIICLLEIFYFVKLKGFYKTYKKLKV